MFYHNKFVSNAHLWRNSHYIGCLEPFTHFGNRCQWGRSFGEFKGSWFYALSFFLSICLSCSCIFVVALHVEYIEETPPIVMVHHTCIYCGGDCSIYYGCTNITYFWRV